MTLLIATVAAAAGLILGSFAVTAGLRTARGEQALTGRSRCDGCAAPLTFAATAPVVSFVMLRGTCARCGERISPLHPIGELTGAATAVLAVLLLPPAQAALAVAMGLALLAASATDALSRRLPDVFTLAVAGLALGLSTLGGLERLLIGLAAGAATFLLLEGVRRGFLALRGRPGLGLGDVKLLAALALWLGLATPWALAGAAVLGLIAAAVLRSKDGRIPFGPAIAVAGWSLGLALEAGRLPPLLGGLS